MLNVHVNLERYALRAELASLQLRFSLYALCCTIADDIVFIGSDLSLKTFFVIFRCYLVFFTVSFRWIMLLIASSTAHDTPSN